MKTIRSGFVGMKVGNTHVNSSIHANSGNYSACASRDVSYIVMHYTGNAKDTAKGNAEYFSGAGRNASAHFFVDDNNVYQSVALKDRAWHCGANTYAHPNCRNANSIGIEMCTSGNYIVSAKTKKKAAKVCASLCKMVGITSSMVDTYVLRHYDVTHKNCPAQMAGNGNAEWVEFKNTVKKLLGGSSTSANTTPITKSSAVSYKVKITASSLNVRKGAGTSYPVVTSVKKNEVYTIVGETKVGNSTWGKLKSGAGYICLTGYTVRV